MTRVVTIVQTKGGSGKTTTAMLLASAALDAGRRVTLIDGDVNAQLGRWRDSFELAAWEAVRKPAWPEPLSILSPPETVESLLAFLDEQEARGVDLVVIDTRPGTHTDTEDFCLISDLVLIPARPVFAEWEMTHRAVLWMDDLRSSIAIGEHFPAVRVLVMDAGPKIVDAATRKGGLSLLPKRDQEVLMEILRLDHLDVIVPHSKILEQMGFHGPLGPAAEANGRAPGGRLMADAINRQLEVARLILVGVDEVVFD
jgi:chromosome partitioning protein